ncbi:SGNH/GDSL hydrolase family protein [Vescimonas sp.]|uniref:SGNH/GDSL hydrolase family protein n=1 Tax=Vescimonas sp. TaxID=2892404 RepID=UPI003F7F5479
MDKVVVTKSKLDGLAQHINAKAGTTGAKTIAQMQETVDGITGAEVFYIDLEGSYPDYTCPVAMADIKAAYEAGKVLECRCALGLYTATLPLFVPMPSANTWIFSGAGALTAMGFDAQSLTIAIVNGAVQASQTFLATKGNIPAIPDKLPNPYALTIISGSNSVTYDGSESKDIEIADAGELVTETTEILPAYTNQIPLSTDVSGAILNGVGYESGQLGMDGSVTTGTSFVSGFIPVKKGDVIRVKDPSSTSFSTGLVFALYNSSKATGSNIGRYINTMQANASYGTVSISGNVLTWDTSNVNYYFWNNFAYLRVTTNSAASIVTVNEEIVETTQKVMTLKPTVKVGENNLNFNVATALLAGKKVVVFGDSIIGMTRDQTSVPAYAATYTGATIYNVGFGGCRMSVHPTNGYAAFSMWALADAVSTGDYAMQDAQASSGSDYFPEQLALLKTINFNDVDMVVIHYGTNDFAANVAIDNASDDDDTATLCGALRYSLRKLMTAYPKLRIFVSVPIYRKWNSVGAETYTNSNGVKLIDFCEAMARVATEFNCPVMNGYRALGINTINDAAFSADGTHLNDYGRKAFGQFMGGNLIAPVPAQYT